LDLLALLGRELGAPGLVVDAEGFLTLLDHLLEHSRELLVAQRAAAGTTRLDIAVLDGRIHHSQRRDAALVAALHGLLQGGIDVVPQHDSPLSQAAIANRRLLS